MFTFDRIPEIPDQPSPAHIPAATSKKFTRRSLKTETMNKNYLLTAIALFFADSLLAQSVAINTDGSTANTSAILDVKSNTKGILIPRMSKAERTSIASPATGLMVFQHTPDSLGFYYYDGSQWSWVAAINGNADTLAWKRSGNASTNPVTHFIGTTDNKPLHFRVNNTRAGFIDNTSYNLSLGYSGFLNNSTGTHNTAIGFQSLQTNTTGNYNTAIGAFSSFSNASGIRNTAIGTSALYFNTSNDNTAIGYEALNQTAAVAAKNNTAIGANAGRQNVSGTANTAIGDSALYLSSTASYNVAIGKNAGRDNLGSWTTFVGIDAGPVNTANGSVFVGSAAGMRNTSGSANTFVGDNAGRDVVSASGNSFFGSFAGQINTANENSFFGRTAGFSNTSGNYNTFIGAYSGYFNSTGVENSFLGRAAGFTNSVGNNNTFLGAHAGNLNSSGSNNSFVGKSAGLNTSSGTNNTVLGSQALMFGNGSANTALGAFSLSNLSGTNNYNVAVGDSSARNLATGANNVAVGSWAMKDHTTGNQNTAIGNFAMGERESGSYNVALGAGSLWNTNNDYNTGIGYQTGFQNISGTLNTYLGAGVFTVDGLTNGTGIGANSFINASNKVRIGSSTVTVIEGQVAYTFPSDGRFKTQVTESIAGLDFITRLRPVAYNFQTAKYDAFIRGPQNEQLRNTGTVDFTESEKIRHNGFIAQEVWKAAKDAGYEFDGVHVPRNSTETYSIAYSQFVVPLVKAVQEQQVQIEELKKQVAELKAALNKPGTGK